MRNDLHSAEDFIRAKLGLGCVTFGREITRADSFSLLDYACSRGVRYLDTAAAYGGGASETIVGDWLQANPASRQQLTVATKLLPPYAPATIEAGLRASLARLKLDRVDVLFLHQWHDSILDPAVTATLDALRRRGLVGALGGSNLNAFQLSALLDRHAQAQVPPLGTLQNIHNYAVRGFDPALRELCTKSSIHLVGYSPLGAGFLTDKHQRGIVPGSRFALIPGHQAIYLNKNARSRLAQLKQAAAEANASVIHLALAWALRDPQVETVLVGGRERSHLDQAFAALNYLHHEVFIHLDAAAADRGQIDHGT